MSKISKSFETSLSVVKTELPMQGVPVPSLVWELGSHMPLHVARKFKKKKCNITKSFKTFGQIGLYVEQFLVT